MFRSRSNLARRGALTSLVLASALVLAGPVAAADEGSSGATGDSTVRSIVFPVVGDSTWTDTFGAPRSGGRTHQGQDLMATKMQELVAVEDATVTYASVGATAGGIVELRSKDGWVYSYLHLNNDTPGTDDGAGTAQQMFGLGISRGASVVAGQVVGYLGDSGNGENTPPHVHFEMKSPAGVKINPAESLRQAVHLDAPTGNATSAAAPSPIPRLAGADRVATAIALSKAGWPNGSTEVVVAAGDRYAEALPAAVLAGARSAPLLLTTGSSLTSALAGELDRLGARQVTIVGSVPAAVADVIAKQRSVTRVGVAGNAVQTSVSVAGATGGSPDTVVLVNAERFADGISASALAAGRGWPVLLTSSTVVPQQTVDAWRSLGVRRVVLVGGNSVIGANVEDFIRTRGRCGDSAGCEVERIAGTDRYQTSAATAKRSLALGGRTAANVLVGTGSSYPDALASGPLAARVGGITVLVDGVAARADAASRALLAELSGEIEEVSILGGTSAVGATSDQAIQHALGLAP